MKCVVGKLEKQDINVRCLCGMKLKLGNAADVRTLFNDKSKSVGSSAPSTVSTATSMSMSPVPTNQKESKSISTTPSMVSPFMSDDMLYCTPPPLTSNGSHSLDSNEIRCDSLMGSNSSSLPSLPSLPVPALISPSASSSADSVISTGSVSSTASMKPTKSQSKTRTIKRAVTYRCAWCLKRVDSKSKEKIYFCPQQKDQCIRIIKKHHTQFQPFVVCIACVLQSDVELFTVI